MRTLGEKCEKVLEECENVLINTDRKQNWDDYEEERAIIGA